LGFRVCPRPSIGLAMAEISSPSKSSTWRPRLEEAPGVWRGDDLDDLSTCDTADISPRRLSSRWADADSSEGAAVRLLGKTHFAWEDLLLKPWSSWNLRNGEDGRERITHVVLYYMIWWTMLPVPWVLSSAVCLLPLASSCLLILASNNHWRDVRYGEWRHKMDSIAVSVTFAVYFAFLFQGNDPDAHWRLVRPSLPLCAISLVTFGLAWYRHLCGCVEEGLFWHLLFRNLGAWLLVFTQAQDSDRGWQEWLCMILVHSLLYWWMAWRLWVGANRLLKPPPVSEEQPVQEKR